MDRHYVGQGIGRALLTMAHRKAGGEDDITMTTISNEKAVGFYESCGMRSDSSLMVKYCREWEEFTVT